MKRFSKRLSLIMGAVFVGIVILAILAYVSAQTLTLRIVESQLHRNGYPAAEISNLRLYLDGIVIGHVQLNAHVMLTDLFTPQSAPDLAQNGLRHIIVRHWDQTITDTTQLTSAWPFPKAESLSVETMDLHLSLPLQTVTLSGTLKSLQPEPGNLVLVLPFAANDPSYTLDGKLEITLENGVLTAVDINVDDGAYESATVSLKRLSGWFNAQFDANRIAQIQSQFLAGSALYNNQPFADAMVQYSHDADNAAQWTVNLNRAGDGYFNSWVIKPTTDRRYAIQIASQNKTTSKSSVMISAAPLQLEPLLPAQ